MHASSIPALSASCLVMLCGSQVQGLVSEGDGTLQAQLLEMLRLLLDAETMQAVRRPGRQLETDSN